MKIAHLVVAAGMLVMPSVMLPQPPQDRPFDVNEAREHLGKAKDFLANAGGDWGGHRVAAMHHIDEAQRELNEAERWAHAHHDIR